MKYQKFVYEDYSFDASTKKLTLNYSYNSQLHFSESYIFDYDYVAYDPKVLDRALQNLFFMAGVSYYKSYLAPEIAISRGETDDVSAKFFSKTYQRGLGEFFYVNKLNPNTLVNFPITTESLVASLANTTNTGLLVAIGGGKDSLVSLEILRRSEPDIATWSLNHRAQLTPLITRIGLPHYWVEREWDPKLSGLKNDSEAYNGHVPISAIFACVGTVVAILTGRRDVVVSNEQSASEPTLDYQGVDINHQYSKSYEFEQDYQALLNHTLGNHLRYYSFLRPLSEVHIAELFARTGFQKYTDVFSSCNRAFVHDSTKMFWDGTCAKCAFIFLALTPFVPQEQLETLFSGNNLLKDPSLSPVYKQLLGIEGERPLDCVGGIKESRVAMSLARSQYPELASYHYDIPEGYDYRQLGAHLMPAEYYDKLLKAT